MTELRPPRSSCYYTCYYRPSKRNSSITGTSASNNSISAITKHPIKSGCYGNSWKGYENKKRYKGAETSEAINHDNIKEEDQSNPFTCKDDKDTPTTGKELNTGSLAPEDTVQKLLDQNPTVG